MKKTIFIITSLLLTACASNNETAVANKVEMIKNSKFKTVSNENYSQNFNGEVFPETAEAGQCFTKVMTPAVYNYKLQKVMTTPASTTYRTIPARYKFVTKRITTKDASERLVTIPAQYKYETSQLMTKEAGTKLSTIPARFKTVKETILISPAKEIWKRGEGTEVNENGILCKVKVPAKYKTVYKKVLVTEARSIEKVIPAEFKMVKKKVVAVPASVKTVIIPAETKLVKVKELVEPARQVPVEHAAKFQTIKKKLLVKSPVTKWAPILCKTNAHAGNIKVVQKALKLSGYNPGKLDGVLGRDTANAIKSFQRNNSLATGGLTLETLKALNVKL